MRVLVFFSVLSMAAQTSDPAHEPMVVAKFAGSGTESIQAMATDSAGNIYVAGTTSSADFPVLNSTQPFSGDGTLMRSTDLGMTWTKLPNTIPDPRSITPHPSDPMILFCTGGLGIYKTSDGGKSWRQVFSWSVLPPCLYCNDVPVAIDPADPRYVYGIGSQTVGSIDGGDSWHVLGSPPYLPWAGRRPLWVDPWGSGAVGYGMSLSRDRGLHWTNVAPPGAISGANVPTPWRSGQLFAKVGDAYGATAVYESLDWGQSWVRKDLGLAGNGFRIDELLFDPDRQGTIYATRNAFFTSYQALMVSEDFGASWRVLPGPAAQVAAILERKCAGGVLLGAAGEQAFASTDSGASWQTTWQTPALNAVQDLTSGPGCVAYLTRTATTDAFVAKISPAGEVLWSTFLGGAEADTAFALALDAEGSVYVAGNTASSDFPSTLPRLGVVGMSNGFLTKLGADGTLKYSIAFGGEGVDTVTGLGIGASGEAYITGWTYSTAFPTTQGGFQTTAGTSNGFAIKFDGAGRVVYSTFLPGFSVFLPRLQYDPPHPPQSNVAVAVESGGTVLVGGSFGIFGRLSADGATLTPLAKQPGEVSAMTVDGKGDIYVAGRFDGPGTMSGECFYGFAFTLAVNTAAGDVYVTKLSKGDLGQFYFTHLGGQCASSAKTLSVGPDGEVYVGAGPLYLGQNPGLGHFPLVNPVFQNPRSVVFELGPDGSQVTFSSYMGSAGPAVAAGPGAMYSATSSTYPLQVFFPVKDHARVVRIPTGGSPGGMSIGKATNAFSGAQGAAATGMLLRIDGVNFADSTIDLGLDHSGPLPTVLGGVRVLFDGMESEMFRVAPDHVICIVPVRDAGTVSKVQVVRGDQQRSTVFTLAMGRIGQFEDHEGFLSAAFPDLPGSAISDGLVRNPDGTLNDADHPAPLGSTVTLFATGLGDPAVDGATIKVLGNPITKPVRFYLPYYVDAKVRSVPGFVHGLAAVDVPVFSTAGISPTFVGLGASIVAIYVK